jgi:hypothetical protein
MNTNKSVIKSARRHSNNLRKSIFKISALTLATALANQGLAQDIEEIQVTGSRIQREGMESPTPVTQLSLD